MDTHTKHITRNPFYEAPWPKAYYHPSLERNIPEKLKRKSCLSPENRSPVSQQLAQNEQLGGSVSYTNADLPVRQTPRTSHDLNESWPDTERSSLSHALSYDHVKTSSRTDLYNPLQYSPEKVAEKTRARLGDLSNVARDKEAGTVISSYLNRFRYGVPTSRQERAKRTVATAGEFWWANENRSPSPPTAPGGRSPSSSPAAPRRRSPSPSPAGRGRVKSSLPGSTEKAVLVATTEPGDELSLTDEHCKDLFDKTERILNWSASTLSERAAPVSSVQSTSRTLSTDHTVPTDSPAETASRQSFRRENDNDRETTEALPRIDDRHGHLSRLAGLVGAQTTSSVAASPPRRKDGDILQQWRLRRKIEMARAGPQLAVDGDHFNRYVHVYKDNDPSPRKPSPVIHFTPPRHKLPSQHDLDSEPVKESCHRVLPPVSPHQHYLCDILPCQRTMATTVLEPVHDDKVAQVPPSPSLDSRLSPQKAPTNSHPERQSLDTPLVTERNTKLRGDSSKITVVSEVQSVDDVASTAPGGALVGGGRVEDSSEWVNSDSTEMHAGAPTRARDSTTSEEVVVKKRVSSKKATEKRTKLSKKETRQKKKLVSSSVDSGDDVKFEANDVSRSLSTPKSKRLDGEEIRNAKKGSEKKSFSSPVKSVVTEVITEHLFASTPRCSVIDHSESDDDDVTYINDDILQQLVRRQEKYTKQLTLIDHLLERCEDKQTG